MAEAREWRVGLIGAGMVSRHHLAAWAEVPQARVVAIADRDLDRAERRARNFGVAAAYVSAEELLAAQRLDAVDIAAPVDQHGTLCRLAAERGVAILCQKPLAASVEEAGQILAAVAGRVRFMVNENWRFRRSYRQVKAWLDAGRIGHVTGVSLSVRSSGLVADAAGRLPALRRQPFLAELPRLLVFEVLIHHIDVLRWLFGALSVKAVSLRRGCTAVRGEDGASIRFDAEGGLSIEVDGSLSAQGAPLHISDRMDIIGTEGAIHLADGALSLEAERPESFDWDFEAVYLSAFEGAQRHFIGRLADGGAFETEAAENIAVLQLVEDVYNLRDG